MKKIFVLVLTLVFLVGVPGPAIAAPEPPGTITIAGDTVIELGQSTTFSANWASIVPVKYEQWSDGQRSTYNILGHGSTGGTSSLTFFAAALGEYTIRYSILDSDFDEIATAHITVTVVPQGLPVVPDNYIEPMAAPAVATKILAYSGVAASGDNGPNLISAVARNMTKGATFAGERKAHWCENEGKMVSNPAYREKVLLFLTGLDTGPELQMPCDGFFAGTGCSC